MFFKSLSVTIKYEFSQVNKARLTWVINFFVPLIWLIPLIAICRWFNKTDYQTFYSLSIMLWSNMRGIIFFIGLTATKKKNKPDENSIQKLFYILLAKTIVHIPLLIITNIITLIPEFILFGKRSSLSHIAVKPILLYFGFLVFLYLLAYLISFLIYYSKKVRVFFSLYERYAPFLTGIYYPVSLLPLPLKAVCMLMPLTYFVNSIRAGLCLEPYLIGHNSDLAIVALLDVIMLFVVIGFYRSRFKTECNGRLTA
ncbi:hypothetical protein [Anaerobacterium chartisolvens]|nr:hypothetical protein [Anaerobacterium chartisolvens]